jgi:hypothetical protein
MDGVDVESTAALLGLTEDKLRQLCLEHEREILERMTTSAEDAIREFAYIDGALSLDEPEIPEPVHDAAAAFRSSGHLIDQIILSQT